MGLPIWLANLEDVIFEGLPLKQALLFPASFLKAIPIGLTENDFELIKHKIAILRQKRNLKLQQNTY